MSLLAKSTIKKGDNMKPMSVTFFDEIPSTKEELDSFRNAEIAILINKDDTYTLMKHTRSMWQDLQQGTFQNKNAHPICFILEILF
jgi:hypothetical protein